MKLAPLPDEPCARLSEFIADAMGLHFPPERWSDLQRGLAGAAGEFGFDDVAACANWLLSSPPTKARLEVLANHLTIGETYFFRETKTFEALTAHVLPELIRFRRGRDQRLRLWSAACCTGEEAYSLAILLRQSLPDLADWHVTILATDINARFLKKAVAGTYGEWSFRNAPAGFKERYFTRNADAPAPGFGRYTVVPEIREMVTFAPLNLVEDVYPSLATQTNAIDLIFCRNVLMYFTPAQIRKVIGNLHRSLIDGGWLAVSPSETSQALFPQFVTRNFPGVILYEKNEAKVRSGQLAIPEPPVETEKFFIPAPDLSWVPPTATLLPTEPLPDSEEQTSSAPTPTPYSVAVSLYEQGRYAETAETLLDLVADRPPDPQTFSLLARTLANQGKVADSLTWCNRWISADKLDSAGHYLQALVLLEQGDPGAPDEARRSLQRAIYLQPDFVLAHFALGNLSRSVGKSAEADKHFGNALRMLARYQPNDLLPESDNLTVARLTETINALTTLANVP